MLFSNTCKYGLRAVLYIAEQSAVKHKSGIKEIAAEIESPEAFTAKVLQILVKKKIIKSSKGPNGGFYIHNLDKPIYLITIVHAIEGKNFLTGCGLGLKSCSDAFPCPIHNTYKIIRSQVEDLLNLTSIQQLASGISEGRIFLKRLVDN